MSFSSLDPASKPLRKSTRWLITGGCGFIGRNLVKYLLLKGGHQIRIIDNLSIGSLADLSQVCNFSKTDISAIGDQYALQRKPHPDVELITADILDSSLALHVSKDIDIIIHLAANTGVGPSVDNPKMDCKINVFGTFNYLEAARHNKIKRFIFASSGAPIGECIPPIHEELAPHPVSPYGASKLAGEAYCSAYYKTFGVETIALRFGNVYGPLSSNKSSVIAKFIKQSLIGEVCEIYGDGMQTRDFIYVDDLIQAIYKAATIHLDLSSFNTKVYSSNVAPAPSNIGGEIFQIATNKEHSIKEVTEIMKSEFKNSYDIDMQIKYSSPRIGDVMRNFSDTSKSKKILNWESDTSLTEGIKKTVSWFIRQ